MSRTMSLCPECRTIQKAASVCTICGAKVQSPNLIVMLPKKPSAGTAAPAKNSDEPPKNDNSDAA